jgi:protein-disulfide isomerase
MKNLSRRLLLASSAALAFVPVARAEDPPKPVDQKLLNTPSAIGEMAQGSETAKVTIIEYASASCPHCRDFFHDVYVPLKKDYIDTGKVRFVFREFPHNDPALAAFMLARCAPKEKYFPMIDVFFQTQDVWLADPMNGLKNIAQQAGLSAEAFDACLKNQEIAKGVLDVRKGGEALGVAGIPTIFVNGALFDGERTYDAMKAKIDPLLL